MTGLIPWMVPPPSPTGKQPLSPRGRVWPFSEYKKCKDTYPVFRKFSHCSLNSQIRLMAMTEKVIGRSTMKQQGTEVEGGNP